MTRGLSVTLSALAAAPLASVAFMAPAHADPASPLQPLVDAAAARLQTAEPVAASKYLTGGQIEDPQREQQVLDAVSSAAAATGADPAYVREVFRDQIDATVSLQYNRFAQWKIDPADVPATAPDLADTRATIDALNQTMVREIGVQWPVLHASTCAADLGNALVQVVAERQLDPQYRDALSYATHDYCR